MARLLTTVIVSKQAMAQVHYPYIDLTVLPDIRPHVIAPYASVLLTPDMKRILWANGEGARLIGTPMIGQAVEGTIKPKASMLRQIEMAADKLTDDKDAQSSAVMRVKSGFQTKVLAFTVRNFELPDGKPGVLLVTDSMHGRAHKEADMARAAVDCLDGQSHGSAVFDGAGNLLAQSDTFDDLDIATDALEELAMEITSEEDRLIKRPIKTKQGMMPAGVARLSDSPALHLIVLAQASPESVEAGKKKSVPAPKKIVEKAEEAPETDAAGPSVGAFSSKRLKPGEAGLGRWYYKPVAKDDVSEEKLVEAEPIAKKAEEPKPTAKKPTKAKKPVKKAAPKTPPPKKAKPEKATPKKTASKKPAAKKAASKSVPKKVDDTPETSPSSGLIQTTEHTPISGSPRDVFDGQSAGSEKKAKKTQAAIAEDHHENDGFRFTETAQPVRFAWEMDAETVFTRVSPEMGATVGPKLADIEGLSWREVCSVFALDGEEDIAALLEKGDTWSGKTVLWPVQGTDMRVPIDLAGLPSFGRNRDFAGFNGFGIVRTADAVLDPAATGLNFGAAGDSTVDFADEAKKAIGDELPQDDKVVSLRSIRDTGSNKSLSNDEKEAFDEIGEKLGDEPVSDLEAKKSDATDETNDARDGSEEIIPSAFVKRRARAPEHDVDTSILARLPIPVLVYRSNDLLFANREFFKLTGYSDLDELAEAGGVDALFRSDEIEDLEEDAHIFHQSGTKLNVFPNLQRVPWDDDRAMLLTLRHNGPDGPGDGGDGGNDDPGDRPGKGGDGRLTKAPPKARNISVTMGNGTSKTGSASSKVTPLYPAKMESDGATFQRRLDDGHGAAAFGELSNDDLRSVLDTASDGIVVMSRDGKVRALNRSAEALFDVNSSDAAGEPFIKYLAPESHKAALGYLENIGGTGVASVLNDGCQIIGRTSQGGLLPLSMTVGRMSTKDTLCAVLKDITHWKKSEEELLTAKHVAETASKQKTDFLAKVSHEIRTPLNAIIGFSDLMIEERFGQIDNNRYREYLRDIHRSGNHVLELVNDLLDISKIEAGELDLDFVACDLNTIASETVAMSQAMANKDRIIIRSSLSTVVPPVVADPRSLRQIILNLVTNGIKFTDAGGQVIVSTVYDETGEVVLRVRDTGIGMTETEMTRAMEPFAQISAMQQDRQTEGTGLGLPLTKAMVEANRAKFHIESEPGKGTLIEIFFPSQRVLADR